MNRAPKRRGRRRVTDVDELVNAMPEHLRNLNIGLHEDRSVRRSVIAEWISSEIPCAGEELVDHVMRASGLTFVFKMRDQLMTPAPQRESGYEPQQWDCSRFEL